MLLTVLYGKYFSSR